MKKELNKTIESNEKNLLFIFLITSVYNINFSKKDFHDTEEQIAVGDEVAQLSVKIE